jgi:hypothetical protein
MKKLFVLTLIGMCLVSTAVFGREIVIRNMTNDDSVSDPARPTTIKFSIMNSMNNKSDSSIAEKKLNGLSLKPGEKIVLDSKNFPFMSNKNNLFVDYTNTCANMLFGVENLGNGNIGLDKGSIHNINSMYGPYYTTKTGDKGNIKEIDFYYANTFFSA